MQGYIPDGFFTFLIWFAAIGIVSAVIGGGWLVYHIIRAAIFYAGAL